MAHFFKQALDDQLIWQKILGAEDLQLMRMGLQLDLQAFALIGAKPEGYCEGEAASTAEFT
ncbi:MAG: hypothetical protein O9313_12750 [Acetobacteraceae bacterium]|nr:hypothetical protein [Acetobacteraceae bacterium]